MTISTRFSLTFATIILLAFGLSSPVTQAQTYQSLYDFGVNSTNGVYPNASVINVNGTLYGTTSNGGTYSNGAIFSFDTTTHTEKLLYSFGTSSTDGIQPNTDLIAVNGILYGTTLQGGTNNDGTLFSFDPSSHAEKILHSFTDANGDGASPNGLLNVGGILYGTTNRGGSFENGMAYAINSSTLTEKILYSFQNTPDGYDPVGSLIEVNGLLYGATSFGTVNHLQDGTVLSINPSTGAESVLYQFGTNSNSDAGQPVAGLTNVNGLLYGTTAGGGANSDGTIYSINPTTHTEKVLYSFTGGTDGSFPEAALINVNGILYGTTSEGGNPNHEGGTVFSFDPTTNTEITQYVFRANNINDGSDSVASLLSIDGTLYGTTSAGGTNSGGTLFSLIPVVPPTAKDDSGRTYYNTTLMIPAPGVLGNDSSGNSSTLTAVLVTKPTHGTITLNSNGSFTYIPNTGYVGTDSFTYRDANSFYQGSIASVSLTINARTPIAINNSNNVKYQTAFTVPAPGVLGNDSNGGSSPMTAMLVTNVAHGTLTLSSSGAFTYTPAAGFVGTDSFTYQAVNAVGKSNIATATLIVQAIAPTANNDAGRCQHNTTLTITAPGVLGNDSTGGNTTTAAIVTKPSHGTITFNSNGSFVYKPTTGFIGTDSFTYKDTNSVGTSNTATCTLTVQ